MKKIVTLVIGIAVLLVSQNVNAQIAGTKHDFSTKQWAPSENKICGVCHATHNAKNEPSAPLWNHQSTAVAAYTLYTSPTFSGQGGLTITNPSASSKLCLSCHDGTVAVENFGNVTTGTNFITGSAKIGGVSGSDMSKDHPISFQYTDALATADGGLKTPSTALTGLGGTITQNLLYNNKMECASCHDVHNKYNLSHLLRISNTNSQLCLTCHNK